MVFLRGCSVRVRYIEYRDETEEWFCVEADGSSKRALSCASRGEVSLRICAEMDRLEVD